MSERHSAQGRHRRQTRPVSQPLFAVGAIAAAAVGIPQMQSADTQQVDLASGHVANGQTMEMSAEMVAAVNTAWTNQTPSHSPLRASTSTALDTTTRASRTTERTKLSSASSVPTVQVTKKATPKAATSAPKAASVAPAVKTKAKADLPIQLASRRISDSFGWRPSHPVSKVPAMHHGLDWAVPEGTNVRSVQAGTVTYTGIIKGYGKRIVVRHASGVHSTYNHLSAISVKPGQKVDRGQILGKVGNTGAGTGPHLHFEIDLNPNPDITNTADKSKMIDPVVWFKQQGITIVVPDSLKRPAKKPV